MKTLYTNLKISACSKDTIAQATKVFPGWIDPDFKNWGLDIASPKTKATKLAVLEMDKDGTFEQIFGSINPDKDAVCLTQAQIISFVKSHKDKLRTDGWATFLLFKVGNGFFVAHVYFDDAGRLSVRVRRFSHDYIWLAVDRVSYGIVWNSEYRHRFVVQQLVLKTSESRHSDTLPLALGKLDAVEEILKEVKDAISKEII